MKRLSRLIPAALVMAFPLLVVSCGDDVPDAGTVDESGAIVIPPDADDGAADTIQDQLNSEPKMLPKDGQPADPTAAP